jgi:hypothetical protein
MHSVWCSNQRELYSCSRDQVGSRLRWDSIAALVLGYFLVPASRDPEATPLDLKGAFTSLVAVTAWSLESSKDRRRAGVPPW